MNIETTPVPTPTPVPPAELLKQAGEIVSVWNTLTPIMAVLLVALVALALVGLMLWISRNSNSQAINVLSNANAAKDREIEEMKKQRLQDREANAQNARILSDQFARSNDLWEANNKQAQNRGLQQQEMVATQGRIAASFEKLLSEGSIPLQKVATDVAQLLILAGSIDTKTGNITSAIEALGQIKTDLNKRLDDIVAELNKRSTKPLPLVTPEMSTEAPPS
jgi:hypothetical protein